MAELANVRVQLCQPPELDCPQRRFLDTRGEGVFHLGFERDLDTAVEEAAACGLRPIMQGRRPDDTGFVYFDTAAGAGVTLLARRTTPEPRATRGEHAR